MRNRLSAVALGLSLSALLCGAEFPADRMFQTTEVAPGIWAFVSPETSGPIPSGNVVAIIGDDGVLVVDSGRFPTLAKRMVAEIRRKTNLPVRYLVHTHWHLDHMVGDGVFQAAFPGITFVSTDFTRRKMLEKQVGYLKDVAKNDAEYVQQIDARVASGRRGDGSPLPEPLKRYLAAEAADIRLEAAELDGATVVAPSLTFARSLTIHLGKREVRVFFLGKGNTEGDTVVFVPDARVVASGDLLVSPIPYGYGCHPAAWIETLRALMALDASAIVPGHGPVLHDWSYAQQLTALLEALRAQVGKAVAEGATLEQAQERVDLSSFKKTFAGSDFGRGAAFDDFFVRSAVDRAYQEARGTMAEE